MQRDRNLLLGSVLISAALLCACPLALDTPLSDPDEGQHASISQEMVDSGDYLIPRFLGEPFRDKPILFFAAQACSLRLLGMNEAAARLPGLVFSLLGVLTTALLAKRLLGNGTALLSAVVLLSMILPMALAQFAVHDVALVPWTNLLLLCLWEIHRQAPTRSTFKWGLLAVPLVALALLTKGLIGIAIVGTGFAFFIIISRQLTWRLTLSGTAILLGGAVLASPWFYSMELASPGYLRYYFVDRHFMGFVTETQHHGNEAWYYYLPVVFGGAMPWMHYAAAWLGLRLFAQRSAPCPDSQAIRFVLCWLGGGLLFLSIAGSKLVTYAMPLFPAVAILAAMCLKKLIDRTLSTKTDRVIGWLFRGTSAFGCVSPFVFLWILKVRFDAPSHAAPWTFAMLAGLASGAGLLLFQRQRFSGAIAVGSLWTALLFTALMSGPGQTIIQRHTQRGLAKAINELPRQPDQVLLVGDRIASVVFYANKDLRDRFRAGGIAQGEQTTAGRWNQTPSEIFVAVNNAPVRRSSSTTSTTAVTPPTEAGHFQVSWRHSTLNLAERVGRSKTR